MNVLDLIQKAQQTHQLERAEIVCLLKEEENAAFLFKAADAVRQKYVGDEVYLRGLIEFSSYCKNNCCYCGLRRDNKQAARYRLSKQEILDIARQTANIGYTSVVLQSGEDDGFPPPASGAHYSSHKKNGPGAYFKYW